MTVQSRLTDRSKPLRVVIGVGGGIAAFKAAHLVRFFAEAGHDVRVIPTRSALNFVGAATFEALSGNPVSSEVFDRIDEVQHVRLGQEADLIVIAPATADLLARLAHGRADDLLTSSCLVATCPVVVAPAMHTEMWNHPATQDNVATLRRHGTIVIEPAHGRLTGKDTGPGRLPEPDHIGELALAALESPGAFRRNLVGKKVVISAGGTHEPLDPVRFLGNASSGRQGFALADVAAQRGADVTIVAGFTEDLPVPSGASVVRVTTAQDMYTAMTTHAAEADIVVMAAAVADYRPATVAGAKLKKGSSADLSRIDLEENPDILASLVQQRQAGQLPESLSIVGFAAETGDEDHTPLEHAVVKLKKKGCDALVANAVGQDKVFGQKTSSGWVLLPREDGLEPQVVEIPESSKLVVSVSIWDAIVDNLVQ